MPVRKTTTERRFHSASRRRRSRRSLAVAAALCSASPTSVSLVSAYHGGGSGYNSVAPWGPTTEQSWRQQRTQYANSYGDNAASSPDRTRDRGGQLANYSEARNANDASFGDNAPAAYGTTNNHHNGGMETQRLIQGGSRRQYAAYGTHSDVHLSTDGGRPLDARVQVWDGPDNASHNVRVWSEDGSGRPMDVAMERADHRWGRAGAYGGAYGGYGYRNGSLDVRNRGPMEYPIRAGVGHRPSPQRRQRQQQQQLYAPPSSSTYARGGAQRMTAAAGVKIQGGTVRHFSLPPTASSVRVTLASGDGHNGLPLRALVELLQGPGRVAQLAEVSNQHGRPFVATFPTPGYGATLAVRNDGPLEYPFYATVEPVSVEGGGSGGGADMGGMGGSGGMGMGRENRYGDHGSGGTYRGGGYNGGYGYNNNVGHRYN